MSTMQKHIVGLEPLEDPPEHIRRELEASIAKNIFGGKVEVDRDGAGQVREAHVTWNSGVVEPVPQYLLSDALAIEIVDELDRGLHKGVELRNVGRSARLELVRMGFPGSSWRATFFTTSISEGAQWRATTRPVAIGIAALRFVGAFA
jgi:hypothetical protein